MRTIFLLIFLAGIGAGFVYPWYVTNFSGRGIGTWRVYERGGAFRPVIVPLASVDEPVRVLVDMTAVAPPEFAQAGTALTITATTGGRTVLAEPLSFSEAKPQEKSPQLREKVYRDEAGVISDLEAGDYTFVLGRGDAEGIRIDSVDLVLRGGAGAVDPRAQPAGFTLAAVGFIGFVLAMRRRRAAHNPNSQPPPPRWGRGAKDGTRSDG
jgi:hypothetical protein